MKVTNKHIYLYVLWLFKRDDLAHHIDIVFYLGLRYNVTFDPSSFMYINTWIMDEASWVDPHLIGITNMDSGKQGETQ